MRRVPSADEYKQHQAANRAILLPTAIGGLYRPIFLKRHLLRNLPQIDLSPLSVPKEWHGSPMASICRAIAILGSGRFSTVDRPTVKNLTVLRDLYFFGDDLKSESDENTPHDEHHPTKRALENPGPEGSPRNPRNLVLKGVKGWKGNTGPWDFRSQLRRLCAVLRLFWQIKRVCSKAWGRM